MLSLVDNQIRFSMDRIHVFSCFPPTNHLAFSLSGFQCFLYTYTMTRQEHCGFKHDSCALSLLLMTQPCLGISGPSLAPPPWEEGSCGGEILKWIKSGFLMGSGGAVQGLPVCWARPTPGPCNTRGADIQTSARLESAACTDNGFLLAACWLLVKGGDLWFRCLRNRFPTQCCECGAPKCYACQWFSWTLPSSYPTTSLWPSGGVWWGTMTDWRSWPRVFMQLNTQQTGSGQVCAEPMWAGELVGNSEMTFPLKQWLWNPETEWNPA